MSPQTTQDETAERVTYPAIAGPLATGPPRETWKPSKDLIAGMAEAHRTERIVPAVSMSPMYMRSVP